MEPLRPARGVESVRRAAARPRVRGNPVRIRSCPAAVCRNDRRHTHWAHAREATASRNIADGESADKPEDLPPVPVAPRPVAHRLVDRAQVDQRFVMPTHHSGLVDSPCMAVNRPYRMQEFTNSCPSALPAPHPPATPRGPWPPRSPPPFPVHPVSARAASSNGRSRATGPGASAPPIWSRRPPTCDGIPQHSWSPPVSTRSRSTPSPTTTRSSTPLCSWMPYPPGSTASPIRSTATSPRLGAPARSHHWR